MFIERDQKINKMQSDLFNQLSEIVDIHTPKNQKEILNRNDVKFVDIESAIRELLEMGVR